MTVGRIVDSLADAGQTAARNGEEAAQGVARATRSVQDGMSVRAVRFSNDAPTVLEAPSQVPVILRRDVDTSDPNELRQVSHGPDRTHNQSPYSGDVRSQSEEAPLQMTEEAEALTFAQMPESSQPKAGLIREASQDSLPETLQNETLPNDLNTTSGGLSFDMDNTDFLSDFEPASVFSQLDLNRAPLAQNPRIEGRQISDVSWSSSELYER